MMSTYCSKHVEAYNKSYYKTRFCASSWLITKIILRCTVSKTSNKIRFVIWNVHNTVSKIWNNVDVSSAKNRAGSHWYRTSSVMWFYSAGYLIFHVQWVPGLSRGVKNGRGVTLTTPSLLVPCSRKSRAIHLLPLRAVRPLQSLSACTREHFAFTYTSTPPTDRTACTEPQCLYKGALNSYLIIFKMRTSTARCKQTSHRHY